MLEKVHTTQPWCCSCFFAFNITVDERWMKDWLCIFKGMRRVKTEVLPIIAPVIRSASLLFKSSQIPFHASFYAQKLCNASRLVTTSWRAKQKQGSEADRSQSQQILHVNGSWKSSVERIYIWGHACAFDLLEFTQLETCFEFFKTHS